VVKLVYTLRSGRSGGNPVKVQVLSAPPSPLSPTTLLIYYCRMPEFIDPFDPEYEPVLQLQPKKVGRIQKIMRRLFPPADTAYQYAFPFSTYSGPAGPIAPVLRARQRLRYGEVLSPELMTAEEKAALPQVDEQIENDTIH
jgi:hypothetical protein